MRSAIDSTPAKTVATSEDHTSSMTSRQRSRRERSVLASHSFARFQSEGGGRESKRGPSSRVCTSAITRPIRLSSRSLPRCPTCSQITPSANWRRQSASCTTSDASSVLPTPPWPHRLTMALPSRSWERTRPRSISRACVSEARGASSGTAAQAGRGRAPEARLQRCAPGPVRNDQAVAVGPLLVDPGRVARIGKLKLLYLPCPPVKIALLGQAGHRRAGGREGQLDVDIGAQLASQLPAEGTRGLIGDEGLPADDTRYTRQVAQRYRKLGRAAARQHDEPQAASHVRPNELGQRIDRNRLILAIRARKG
mmetsp:Transcript_10020/g.29142  ORF Transcript_10020/g.29142 Transcript_10020/m.29142 type:complete len:310 (-) Transcript_10020:271-1200(-)